MSMLVVADVDRHLIAGLSLIGLVLAVLGSFFFLYELLGAQDGPLRALLRVIVPTLVGAIVLGGVTLLLDLPPQAGPDPVPFEAMLAHVLSMAGWGAALGTFNGVFADGLDIGKVRPWFMPFIDALVGFLVILTYALLEGMLYFLLVHLSASVAFAPGYLVPTTGVAAVGGVMAGIWRIINRSHPQPGRKPRLFSGGGLLVGVVAGVGFIFIIEVAGFALEGVLFSDSVLLSELTLGSAIHAATAGLVGGGTTGGLTRYIFWWANALGKHSLEAIGIALIVLALVAQAVGPALTLFDVAVK